MQLLKVKDSIKKSEQRAKKTLGSVRLIAVSKVQSNDKIELFKRRSRCFGENRVQEALG